MSKHTDQPFGTTQSISRKNHFEKESKVLMKKRSNGEGSIRKKKNGRWTATLTVGHDAQGKQKRVYFAGKTQAEVRDALERAKADRGQGVLVENANLSFKAYFAQYLEFKRTTVRYNTHRSLEYLGRVHITPRLGKLPLSKLTALNVQAFVTGLVRDGKGPHVVSGALRVLKMALRQAVRWELIGRNPADNVKAPKLEREEMKVWTREEASRFLRVTEGHRLYAVFYLALITGMRKGELVGLRWEEVNFAASSLTVKNNLIRMDGKLTLQPPKTASSRRVIHLPPDAIKVLEEHRTRQELERAALGEVWQESGMVFTSEIGTMLDPSNLSGFFKRLITRAKVTEIRFHDLRHTCASLLFRHGVPAKVVSDRLGHANVGFTLQVYTHIYDEQRREAAVPMMEMLGQGVAGAAGVAGATGAAGAARAVSAAN
jgi:integrase